jgi:hypothetical protein
MSFIKAMARLADAAYASADRLAREAEEKNRQFKAELEAEEQEKIRKARLEKRLRAFRNKCAKERKEEELKKVLLEKTNGK